MLLLLLQAGEAARSAFGMAAQMGLPHSEGSLASSLSSGNLPSGLLSSLAQSADSRKEGSQAGRPEPVARRADNFLGAVVPGLQQAEGGSAGGLASAVSSGLPQADRPTGDSADGFASAIVLGLPQAGPSAAVVAGLPQSAATLQMEQAAVDVTGCSVGQATAVLVSWLVQLRHLQSVGVGLCLDRILILTGGPCPYSPQNCCTACWGCTVGVRRCLEHTATLPGGLGQKYAPLCHYVLTNAG